MFSLLFQCLKSFGFAGLLIYLRLKFNATRKLVIPGLKYPINMRPGFTDRTTFREIFIKREYDLNLLNPSEVKVIIDAGANIGFTSAFFLNKYPTAKVISIEPDEENFRLMESNLKAYSNTTRIKGAVWFRKEFIQTTDKGYGKRGITIDAVNVDTGLPALSINDLMDEYYLKQIDILKMDIEGSEKEVFTNNYERWLPRVKCLIIELHDRMKPGCSHAVFKAITQYDFSFSIKGENLVFINNSPAVS